MIEQGIQGTDDWFEKRRGKVTASRIADVIARTKSGWGAGRSNYMAQLIVERMTDTTPEGYTNAAMQWGTETEPLARSAYEFYSGNSVDLIDFVDHPEIEMSGASPDGLVGGDGNLEIKCPNTATHIETLLSGAIADKYMVQMQWQMACAGRQWTDFVSFDPRMPEELALWVKRVPRDDERIAVLEKDVLEFLVDLDAKMAQLEQLRAA